MKKRASNIGLLLISLILFIFPIVTDTTFDLMYGQGAHKNIVSSEKESHNNDVSSKSSSVLEISGECNYISYSKIFGIIHSINTKELYTWCGKKPFTSIKGDVQITSDGKLIMCHDDGFTFNKDGKITFYDAGNSVSIRSLTLNECLKFRHENTNYSICTFEEYIKICKQYGKIAFITIRNKHIGEVISEMMKTLDKYKMTDKCIVNSFNYSSLRAIRNINSSIMLSHVQQYKTKVTTYDIDRAVTLGNCIICGFNFSETSTVNDVAAAIDTSVIEYAKEKGVPIYEAMVNSTEIANKLKEYGISGVQMTKVPIFD